MNLELKFDEDKEKIEKICFALGSEVRLDIIGLILSDVDKNLSYTDISRKLGKTPGTITRHIAILREAGIISDESYPGKRGSRRSAATIEVEKVGISF